MFIPLSMRTFAFIFILLMTIFIPAASAQPPTRLPAVNGQTSQLMTIWGLDWRKADGLTEGPNLNNPQLLDSLYNLLSTHGSLIVELRYHSPCGEASEAFFEQNNSMRAQACAQYLSSKGIDPQRMMITPVGNTELLKDCKCGDCTEEQLYWNDRLEVIRWQ